MNRIFSLFIIAAVITAASCVEDTGRKINNNRSLLSDKRTFKLEISGKRAVFNLGDTLSFKVVPSDAADTIKQVEIFSDNSKNPLFSGSNTNWQIPTTKLPGGDGRLRIVARYADGEESTRYKEIKVLAVDEPEVYTFSVVNRYNHDKASFTQGFLFKDGYLYEGTGNYGKSKLRKLDLVSGEVLMEKDVDPDYFGEGITIFNDKLYQLTYKSSKCFVYNAETFELEKEFYFDTETGEGWGLTHNDTALIMSDGSANLYFRDPETFEETGRVKVFNNRGNQNLLNELEYYKGKVYANIYTEPYIAVIDPKTGVLESYINLVGIMTKEEVSKDMDVLNGIAINPLNGNLIVTGKYWPTIYEVKLEKKNS